MAFFVVWASGWDYFTDNLAIDFSPLITLFGERPTKQFLSESISILDNFIFAEGPGDVEKELLSCVSDITAEIFNEGGISRVIGRPRILELMVWEEDDESEGKNGARKIGTLRDALQQNAWVTANGYEILDEKGHPPELDIPNLSLNKGIERRSQWWFYTAAVLGFMLQAVLSASDETK
ncbi:hypothetical protein EYZ11_010083 [Aspergillus tanneri]|uniref:Uncharacterized protein n=1 Tax=Aspergillus tanneri TaxID=1220188 RepID=A0A4S3JBM3_9EURO|nr:hypothetical protein EYZ11_010083 [Aspergillus tanneri]